MSDIEPCDIDAVAEMIDEWNERFTIAPAPTDRTFGVPNGTDLGYAKEKAVNWYRQRHAEDATLTQLEALDKFLVSLLTYLLPWSMFDVWHAVTPGKDYKGAVRLLEWRPSQEAKHWVLRYTVTRPDINDPIDVCIDKVPLIDSDTGETFYGDWQ